MLITMINIPLGLPLRIIRKPAKPLAAAALSGEGGSFPLIGYILKCDSSLKGCRHQVTEKIKTKVAKIGKQM